MMGRIEVNALLGYCRDMLLSIDHIASDEDDEWEASFCGRKVDLRRLEAAFISRRLRAGEKKKRTPSC